MSTFTPSGSGGAAITANIPGKIVPNQANVIIAAANVEQSYTFPADTKEFLLHMRTAVPLKVSYFAGQSDILFDSVPANAYWGEDNLDVASLTIYFQSPTAGSIVEIRSWT